jgi:hypothetical protein
MLRCECPCGFCEPVPADCWGLDKTNPDSGAGEAATASAFGFAFVGLLLAATGLELAGLAVGAVELAFDGRCVSEDAIETGSEAQARSERSAASVSGRGT